MQQEIEAAAPQTMDVVVKPPAERAALALGSAKAEKELAELVAKSADIVAVIDPAGRQQAHQMGMVLTKAGTAIQAIAKAAREDATAYSKAVIKEEERLVGIVAPEKKRVLALRDAYDEKVAAEKAEADRIEGERKAAIRAAIDHLRATPSRFVGGKSDDIALMLEALAGKVIDKAEFAEFVDDAQAALDYAGNELNAMHQAAKQREDAERDRLIAIEKESARLAAQAEANRKEEARLADLRREAELAESERKRVAAVEAAAAQKRIDDAKVEQAEAAAAIDRAKRESDAAAARDQNAMAQIAAIQHQVLIAETGRAPYCHGGDIASFEFALKGAREWRIEASEFGSLIGLAKMAQQTVITTLEAGLEKLRQQQAAALAALAAQDAIDKAEAERLAKEEAAKPKVEPAPAAQFTGVDIDAAHDQAPLTMSNHPSIEQLARTAAEDALRDAVRGMIELDATPELILSIVNEELTVTA